MIVGGSEAPITPLSFIGFCRSKSKFWLHAGLTVKFNENPEIGSRPFDRSRSGFVMGEGAGNTVLIIKGF